MTVELTNPAQRREQRQVAPPLNPFAVFGVPGSPLRMMFAPLEIALFLPAYAIDSFHGQRSRRK